MISLIGPVVFEVVFRAAICQQVMFYSQNLGNALAIYMFVDLLKQVAATIINMNKKSDIDEIFKRLEKEAKEVEEDDE